ncbi:hypothetical protein NST41_28610 [Paenibacillus sp. FSL L8-0696]|uniref:hypothetical protein n=1 Tax=Paenibacillus sp. FSL L8-0696 TaxID=2954524 RepID=UPI003119F518
MQTTGNLGLKKPEGTDIVDIADLNGNMDILDNAVNGKVDKVTGKQLSTNDYTAAEKTKLAGIATGANNYVHPNHTGDVISTGDGVTAIAAGVIVNADVNASAGIDASKIGTGVVSNAEFGYLDGVTSGIQGQLNGKAPLVTTPQQTTADITYYVRTDGNDNNTGLVNTAGGAFRTITKAVTMIPQIVNHTIVINIANGTYAETVSVYGLGGSGSVAFNPSTGAINDSLMINDMIVARCSIPILIRGIKAISTSTDAFSVWDSINVQFLYCKSDSTALNNTGILGNSSKVYMYGCIASNKRYGIYGALNADMFSFSNLGLGNVVGTYAAEGGRISITGTSPVGTLPSTTGNSGLILSTGVINPWGDNTTASRSGFSANLSANQAITGSATTKLLYAAKGWDNLSEYNTTLARFTSKSGGTYLVSASISLLWVPDAARLIMDVFKNGSFHTRLQDITTGQQNDASIAGAAVMGLSSGDYIEIYVYIGGYNITAFPIGSHFTVLRCA